MVLSKCFTNNNESSTEGEQIFLPSELFSSVDQNMAQNFELQGEIISSLFQNVSSLSLIMSKEHFSEILANFGELRLKVWFLSWWKHLSVGSLAHTHVEILSESLWLWRS